MLQNVLELLDYQDQECKLDYLVKNSEAKRHWRRWGTWAYAWDLRRGPWRFQSRRRGLGINGAGNKVSEDLYSNQQQVAISRPAFMGMLTCYKKILREKKRYLSPQPSVFDFKSSSETCPSLIAMQGTGCKSRSSWQPAVQKDVPTSKIIICLYSSSLSLSMNICEIRSFWYHPPHCNTVFMGKSVSTSADRLEPPTTWYRGMTLYIKDLPPRINFIMTFNIQ